MRRKVKINNLSFLHQMPQTGEQVRSKKSACKNNEYLWRNQYNRTQKDSRDNRKPNTGSLKILRRLVNLQKGK